MDTFENELDNQIRTFSDLEQVQNESARRKLFDLVHHFLLHNTSFLMNVLYRIDVHEEKVKIAFEGNPTVEVVAEKITELILARQLEKIQWRKKYS